MSNFDLTLISNICSKITYSLGLLVQINKRNLFKLILYGPFFVICIIFSLCLARYFILNRYCKASLYNWVGLLHIHTLIFSTLLFFCFFMSYKHLHCQTNVHQFQCSLHTCEIDYLIMGLCVHVRALIFKYVVFLYFFLVCFFLSPFHFIDNLWWYWRLCCRVGRLDDLMVFHQSFVTNETVILSCLCRGLLWMML